MAANFELATKIESVICWQPAKDVNEDCPTSVLEGTPNDDVRFKYIKYD